MDYSIKNDLSKKEYIYFFGMTLIIIGFQTLIINTWYFYSPYVLVSFTFFLILVIFQIQYIKDPASFLLILNFLPLLILDNNFHYQMRAELTSYFPVFVLSVYALYRYLISERDFTVKLNYIRLPIILLSVYFGIIAIHSLIVGKEHLPVLIEYLHFCLYLLIIPIFYLITSRRNYLIILKFLFFISIVIALEYIIYNQFTDRFVTFQSGFLPISVGVVSAYFLMTKRKLNKYIYAFILMIIAAGVMTTLTRTIWIASFLAIVFVFVTYLNYEGKLNLIALFLILIVAGLPLFLARDSGPSFK